MKKLMIAAAAALGLATPAHAMIYFLVSQWYADGHHYCKYGNGAVLVMDAKLCPLQIDG